MSHTARPANGSAPLALGMLALVDAAPLVAALHGGFFKRQGLDVALSVAPSWASLRDRLHSATLDGAQLLPLMPLAASLGLDGHATPLLSALTLSRNGNAITLSSDLARRLAPLVEKAPDAGARARALASARALATLVDERRRHGEAPLRLATVYPFSSHRYQLRYWLASAGIDPDRDLELRVMPPSAMVEQLAADRIDGYCVGAPWNDIAVRRGCGEIVARGSAICENAQEKVFGVRREWQRAHPDTHQALLRALLETCRWLDADPQNRRAAAHWLSDGGYLNAEPADIETSLDPAHAEVVFHRGAANFPWRSQTAWYAAQMRRWGHLALDPARVDEEIERVARPDLYREAAEALGIDVPIRDRRREGGHGEVWRIEGGHGEIEMLPDRFLDDALFDG